MMPPSPAFGSHAAGAFSDRPGCLKKKSIIKGVNLNKFLTLIKVIQETLIIINT